MAAITYLLQDKAGTVYLDVPQGVPSSATLTVKTTGNGDLPGAAVEDQAATVDPLTSAVSAWSSSSPRDLTITVSAGSFSIGSTYLLETPAGKQETVEVVGLTDNGGGSWDVEIRDELPFDVDVATTIKGIRISYSLLATQTTTTGLYRCAWTYTVDGAETVTENLFRVVLATPFNPATSAGFRSAFPEYSTKWDQFVGSEHSWRSLLENAYDRVMRDIESTGEAIEEIVDWSQIELVVYERLLLTMAPDYVPNSEWMPSEWVRHRQTEYRSAIQKFMRAVRWKDHGNDRVATSSELVRDLASIRMER